MEELNIYTLLMAVRGLSNEITARGLASSLGISYSTLARCKNGKWPPSLSLDAARAAIDGYRDRYFHGDEAATGHALLLALQSQGVKTRRLNALLERDGYDALVSAVLLAARDPHEHAVATQPDAPRTPSGTQPHLLVGIPLAIILLIGLFNFSLSSMFTWAERNRTSFALLTLLIAVLPALCGTCVDSPIAWHAYSTRNPHAHLSLPGFSHVAKYGSETGVVPGAGRYDLTVPYLCYQPVCNVLGAMTCLSLFSLLLSLPGFSAFFTGHAWTEFFKVGIVTAFFIALAHTRDQATRSVRPPHTQPRENPDNYLPTRVHVWANGVHLVWVLSLCIVFLLALVAYSFVRFRQLEAPANLAWPYLQGVAFFAFSCTSPYARRTHATGIGSFVPGVAAASLGFAALALACYRPSGGTVVVCACAAGCLVGSLAWERREREREREEWLMEGKGSAAYSLAVTATIVALFLIGLATSAFFG